MPSTASSTPSSIDSSAHGGAAALFRVTSLICLALATTSAWAQDGSSRTSPLAFKVSGSLGLETEAGRALTLLPAAGLEAELGALSGRIEIASALPGPPIDRLSLKASAGLARLPGMRLDAGAIAELRSYGAIGSEFRLGGIFEASVGADPKAQGVRLLLAYGPSWLRSSVKALRLSFWDRDPLVRLGLSWSHASGWRADIAVSDYNGSSASLWLRTFFEFGLSRDFGPVEASLRATLKYSDFFTLTATRDGSDLRLSLRFPLAAEEVLP